MTKQFHYDAFEIWYKARKHVFYTQASNTDMQACDAI